MAITSNNIVTNVTKEAVERSSHQTMQDIEV
jgi:hypothetical protein